MTAHLEMKIDELDTQIELLRAENLTLHALLDGAKEEIEGLIDNLEHFTGEGAYVTQSAVAFLYQLKKVKP